MDSTKVYAEIRRLKAYMLAQAVKRTLLSQDRFRVGPHNSKLTGEGLDFLDLRDYQIGDNVADIDWKAFARLEGPPQVKIYRTERSIILRVLCAVDDRMDYGTQDLSLRELAALLTGSVIDCAASTGDPACFIGYRDTSVSTFLGGLYGGNAGRYWMPAMASVLSPAQNGVNSSRASSAGLLDALARLPGQPSVAVIISDFRELDDKAFEALKSASYTHEIVCLRVSDLRERQLPNRPLCRLLPIPPMIDVRDDHGEYTQILATRAARAQYATRFAENEKLLIERLTAARCAYAHFGTEMTPNQFRLQLSWLLSGEHQHRVLDLNTLTEGKTHV